MILADNDQFTIECDVDDEKSRATARVLGEVFSTYRLEDNDSLDPIEMDVDGIGFLVRYKKLI